VECELVQHHVAREAARRVRVCRQADDPGTVWQGELQHFVIAVVNPKVAFQYVAHVADGLGVHLDLFHKLLGLALAARQQHPKGFMLHRVQDHFQRHAERKAGLSALVGDFKTAFIRDPALLVVV